MNENYVEAFQDFEPDGETICLFYYFSKYGSEA
jgi:hypothetical protein